MNTTYTTERRHDIDWLRVIAIGLLLIYHVAIGFQPWGIMIGFITNGEAWPSLWVPMSMLNVWRIPLLFFVSGMGVFFAMQHRTWSKLVAERSLRIFVPYVFGMLFIYPISTYILQKYYGWPVSYAANPGHLWFLGNIFIYVMLLAPLFYYLMRTPANWFVLAVRRSLKTPFGLIPVVALFIGEAYLVKPYPYELYAMTTHGYILGLLAFFTGFCFVLAGEEFWKMLVRWRWVFLFLATGLFVMRTYVYGVNVPMWMLVIESNAWIFALLALANRHLNRPGKVLAYLSEAAYPVYILHMIFLYLGSLLIFPLELPVQIKFVTVVAFTFVGCIGGFEVVRRIRILRVLFGLKSTRNPNLLVTRTIGV